MPTLIIALGIERPVATKIYRNFLLPGVNKGCVTAEDH
jgi:hypothetical protein